MVTLKRFMVEHQSVTADVITEVKGHHDVGSGDVHG